MRIQVRRGVFETNSSSVHSFSVVSKSMFDKWKQNEAFYDHKSDSIVESSDEVQANREGNDLYHRQFITFDEFMEIFRKENEDNLGVDFFGTYFKEFKAGDAEMVLFGWAGYPL